MRIYSEKLVAVMAQRWHRRHVMQVNANKEVADA